MSDLVRFVLSAGGATTFIVVCAAWLRLRPGSRRARAVLSVGSALYLLASISAVPEAAGHALLVGLHPFDATRVTGTRLVIVVLGSGSITVRDWDGRRFSMTDGTAAARVLEAARVFRLVPAARVISSGGRVRSDDPNIPTGESMRDALVLLGVPADRVVVETESRTTREEAVVVKRLLQGQAVDEVVVVTSDIHMRRSIGVFKAVGINAVPAIARNPLMDQPVRWRWMPSDRSLGYSAAIAHEVLGIVYYAARGWFAL